MMNLFWDWYDSSEDEGGTLTVVILLGGLFLFVLNCADAVGFLYGALWPDLFITKPITLWALIKAIAALVGLIGAIWGLNEKRKELPFVADIVVTMCWLFMIVNAGIFIIGHL